MALLPWILIAALLLYSGWLVMTLADAERQNRALITRGEKLECELAEVEALLCAIQMGQAMNRARQRAPNRHLSLVSKSTGGNET